MGKLTIAERAEAIRFAKELKQTEALRFVSLYPRQLEFIAASLTASEIAILAGNRQGKTLTGGVMAAVWATGLYPSWWPGRRWDRPTTGWVCGDSTGALIQGAQEKIMGKLGSFGSGLIPKKCLSKVTPGHGSGGGLDWINVKHVDGGESVVFFKSYDQDREKWQGAEVDWIWCDEEPPMAHYLEALARLISSRGLIFSTFTPLKGPDRILPRFPGYEIDKPLTDAEKRYRKLIQMPFEEAKHLQDPAVLADLMSRFPVHQRDARLHGLPMLGTGRVFEGITLEQLQAPLRWEPRGGTIVHDTLGELDSRGWAFMWAIDFGIGHPFAAVLLGWNRDRDEIYVLAEIRMADATPEVHAERMRAIAPFAKVAWPHDGNVREKGSGETVISFYKKAGLDCLPDHAQFSGGGYSTEAGIMEMIQRMQPDGVKMGARFFVAKGCPMWEQEFRSYHRKDGLIVKSHDDLMSATRIGVMQIRSAKPFSESKKFPGGARLGGGTQMAKDIDFDLG